MRELTYFVAVSLDGRIAGPDGDFSAFPVEGDHIEMIARDYRDTLPALALRARGLVADGARFSTVVMGWNTYAAGFPYGVHDPYPHLEQIVFTRRPRPADVPSHIRTVATSPIDEVRRLKRAPGTGVWLCGGARLATALAPEIDRLVLKVNPFVLGDGIPLFAAGAALARFAHVATTPYTSGVVVSEYRRARA